MTNITELPKGYDPLQDQEYMSPDMMLYFKQKLEALRSEIMLKESDMSNEIADMQGREPDFVDQGTSEELRYQEVALFEHEEDMLRQIEEALTRIKNNDYGYCLDTGEPIGVKRLQLAPWAKYTVQVQENIEKTTALG